MTMRGAAVNAASSTKGFTIKNTFVEIDDLMEDDFFESIPMSMRQVSEPTFVFGRQVSKQLAPLDLVKEDTELGGPFGHAGYSPLVHSSDYSGDEPETEIEPQQAAQLAAGMQSNLNANAQPWALAEGMWSPPQNPADFCEGMQLLMASAATDSSQGPGAMCHMQFASTSLASIDSESQISAEWGQTVTVMMRNLPNRYSQQMLVDEINSVGFAGGFDFLYLPIDPETSANKGYAFISFVDNLTSWNFKVAYEGKQMMRFNSNKYVSVSRAALQGFEANYAHYATARCSRGDPAARPLFLRESSGALRKGGGATVNRRGGQRRKNNGKSLVDDAIAKKMEHLHIPGSPDVTQVLGVRGGETAASSANGSAHIVALPCSPVSASAMPVGPRSRSPPAIDGPRTAPTYPAPVAGPRPAFASGRRASFLGHGEGSHAVAT
eukprot:CAMPEP_0177345926 /NCGR_PEP_ID=MMETSP0368-20130122/28906_1 /TAXON_ID=447022 ORGANISM="Scrippsiella hangoei-like, Strain SHHI-4" /NCGR_SAMPLE_ID=MMETSP0368 /ASSEMBLY_ACC=CAM_ASM_000363 /LENGTH=436 /DNA_ID=CAMNT_0018807531 /DNA_START=12 /DNA_END=1319 /DNA_ORIENTATION=-